MGISILACLGAVKLEMYAEKQLLHSGSKTKIQSLLEGTWAVLLGSWSRGEGGSGWEEKGWTERGGAPQAVLPTAQSFLGWLPRGRMTNTPSHVHLM